MMQVAHIVPTLLLNRYKSYLGRYHLLLASRVLEDKRYAEFYEHLSGLGHHIILDNDAHENTRGLDPEHLIEAMGRVTPTEVVLQDDNRLPGPETIDLATQCARAIMGVYGDSVGFLGVPWAYVNDNDDPLDSEVQTACDLMDNVPNIHGLALGVKTVGVPGYGLDRKVEVKSVSQGLSISGYPGVPIHLLGASRTLEEFLDPYLNKRARGIDTAKLVHWGLQGYYAHAANMPIDVGRPDDYFTQTCRKGSHEDGTVKYNLEYWTNRANVRIASPAHSRHRVHTPDAYGS